MSQSGRLFIRGTCTTPLVQEAIHEFVDDFVLCPRCKLPETRLVRQVDREADFLSMLPCSHKPPCCTDVDQAENQHCGDFMLLLWSHGTTVIHLCGRFAVV